MDKTKSTDIIKEANRRLVIITLVVAALVFSLISLFITLSDINFKIDIDKHHIWRQVGLIIDGENEEEAMPKTETSNFESKITDLLNSMAQSGSLKRAMIGVRYVTITDEIAKEYDLPVTEGAYLPEGAIIKGQSAEKAGLKAGDIITRINGVKIDSENPLNYLVAKYAAGDEITVNYLRDGNERIVKVKLAAYAEN